MNRKVYVLKNKKTGKVFTSFMIKPLADSVKRDRRTLKNWISNPEIAFKNEFEIYIGEHLTGRKGKNEEENP